MQNPKVCIARAIFLLDKITRVHCWILARKPYFWYTVLLARDPCPTFFENAGRETSLSVVGRFF